MSDQQPDTASSLFKNTNFSRNSSNPAGQTGDLSAESLFSSQNDLSRFHPLAAAQSGALDYLALEDGQLNTLEGTKGVLPSRGEHFGLNLASIALIAPFASQALVMNYVMVLDRRIYQV